MSDDAYEMLFKSIQEKCQHEHWYGSAGFHPTGPRGQSIKPDNPSRFGFAMPPATEDQLQTTEAQLGFPLPPLLRALYNHLANGGFGPGFGLRGVVGGFSERGYATLVEEYQWRSENASSFVTLADYSGKWETDRTKPLKLSYRVWPRSLLPICDLGCVQEICLDSQSGKLFMVAPYVRRTYLVHYHALSLQDWLARWVNGEDVE